MVLMSLSGASVVAHQGGWDEIMLVAGPIVLIVIVLGIAKRRVDAQSRDDSEPVGAVDTDPTDTP